MENALAKIFALGLKLYVLFLSKILYLIEDQHGSTTAREELDIYYSQHMQGNPGTLRVLYNLNPSSGTEKKPGSNYHIRTPDYLRAPKMFSFIAAFPFFPHSLYLILGHSPI